MTPRLRFLSVASVLVGLGLSPALIRAQTSLTPGLSDTEAASTFDHLRGEPQVSFEEFVRAELDRAEALTYFTMTSSAAQEEGLWNDLQAPLNNALDQRAKTERALEVLGEAKRSESAFAKETVRAELFALQTELEALEGELMSATFELVRAENQSEGSARR